MSDVILFITFISSSFEYVTKFTCISIPESKKEEKKAESESEDDDMGFGLFD